MNITVQKVLRNNIISYHPPLQIKIYASSATLLLRHYSLPHDGNFSPFLKDLIRPVFFVTLASMLRGKTFLEQQVFHFQLFFLSLKSLARRLYKRVSPMVALSVCRSFTQKFGWREIGWKIDFWALLPMTSPALSYTTSAHLHYCPCPHASDYFLAVYPALFFFLPPLP